MFLLLGLLALLKLIYKVFKDIYQKYRYFEKRGITQLPTELLYGNTKELILQQKCHGVMFQDFYKKFKDMGVAHGGVYGTNGGIWVPIDTKLIKRILSKDFVHFSAHNPRYPGLYFNNVFHMSGEEWKDRRRKLSPTFTSGKMKMMYDIILKLNYKLADLVEELRQKGEPFEIKEVMVRFTTDIIANCGFGIECDSLKDKNFEFYRLIQDGFSESKSFNIPTLWELILKYIGYGKRLGPNFKAIEDYFREVVHQTVKYREENKVIRKDFLQLMIQLKNKGVVTDATDDKEDFYNKTVKEDTLTLEDLAGQCLMFFSAGFGTSSTTMSFAMLELAQNQGVQEKLRKEVQNVLKKHDGKLTYEALQEMPYCENVIYETLRKYPTLPVLFRMCTQDYTIPDTNIVIEKGTMVQIPVLGLQMDPDHFATPEKFIPERFNAENKDNITEFSFLPFGEGPRMCLGLRFGMMQSKAGLATLVNKFNFTMSKKTIYPVDFKKTAFVPEAIGGIWLDAVKLN